ncbi:hypothetical protein AMEX_G5472 [Astyanax mexicanus]|uniref:Uncharacterized protein n=1 Tax=Astyanax mexicanus TaxID=7994 RepID=A0A8T2M5N5_ASTMX|nr:hypothetical protein AMEX_G5472 [Astyanax mexicanus]
MHLSRVLSVAARLLLSCCFEDLGLCVNSTNLGLSASAGLLWALGKDNTCLKQQCQSSYESSLKNMTSEN